MVMVMMVLVGLGPPMVVNLNPVRQKPLSCEPKAARDAAEEGDGTERR
jgi:hypothetical protein